jgi:hypothetical protein
MRTRGLTQSQSLPVRFVAVVALWVSGTVSLGAALGSPLPIFVLTAAMLALVYVYSRFEAGGRAEDPRGTFQASSRRTRNCRRRPSPTTSWRRSSRQRAVGAT